MTPRPRLFFCLFVVLSTALPMRVGLAKDKPQRPNILLMTMDNVGYGDLGCYGNREIKTPQIDKFATQSVRCTDFYTASPTCTVSRASLLTGRYPQRHGLTRQLPGLAGNYGVGLNPQEVILPRLLAPAGYRTACFGKWNIGFAPGSRPTERGFDCFFGHASGNIDYYRHVYRGKLDLHRGTEPVKVKGYCTDLFADAACTYIRENKENPFFIYLPFNAPHFPVSSNKAEGEPNIYQAPDSAFAAYGYSPDVRNPQKRYYAVLYALDRAIGRVLKQLDDVQLTERTLVILYSDNGAFMLPGRGLNTASNKPLRDGGVTLWEGGIRVPCLVRWPGILPAASECSEPILSCDLLPMIVAAAGGKLPADRTIDGRDPTETLAGRAKSPHQTIFFQYRKFSALRQGSHKLLRTEPKAPWKLFDLTRDIGEQNDIARQHPKLVEQLARQYDRWQQDVRKP